MPYKRTKERAAGTAFPDMKGDRFSMAKKGEVSDSVIKRLPRYYRFVSELVRDGTQRISSGELARRMSVTASQIRQDLNGFGGFGQQGYGYNLSELRSEIIRILGIDGCRKIILIGAGNLGMAIANHMNFSDYGFRLIGIFDSDPAKTGAKTAGLEISGTDTLDDFVRENSPDAAILCIPKENAKETADHLVELGIRAFWNFSHCDIAQGNEGVIVENVHLGDSLMLLSYGIANS